MPHHAKSHEEFRQVICARCFLKPKSVRTIQPNSACLDLVKSFVFKDYNLSNESYPRGLCGSCRLLLLRFKEVGIFKLTFRFMNIFRTQTTLLNLQSIIFPMMISRNFPPRPDTQDHVRASCAKLDAGVGF